MNPQTNSEEEYQAVCLEKALEFYGQFIVSAGLEAKIPPDEIGPNKWIVVNITDQRISDKVRALI